MKAKIKQKIEGERQKSSGVCLHISEVRDKHFNHVECISGSCFVQLLLLFCKHFFLLLVGSLVLTFD